MENTISKLLAAKTRTIDVKNVSNGVPNKIIFDSKGKAIYRRLSEDQGGNKAYIERRNGDSIKETYKIGNQWVVPYNNGF